MNLPEKITTAPRHWSVAAARMLPQRRCTGNGARLYFGNRALVLIVMLMDVVVWDAWRCSPYLTALFEGGGMHHAESILTGSDRLPTSIINAVQGYSKVDRISDTTFKRYEFMCPSA